MFNDWWIVIVCCTVAATAHFLSNRNSNFFIACIDVLLHVGVIITFLFLEMTLRQLFIFILFSVDSDLLFRILFLRRGKAEKAREENTDKNKGQRADGEGEER